MRTTFKTIVFLNLMLARMAVGFTTADQTGNTVVMQKNYKQNTSGVAQDEALKGVDFDLPTAKVDDLSKVKRFIKNDKDAKSPKRYLSPLHLAVVEQWLRINPGYFIAEDKDCGCDDALAYFQSGSEGDKNFVIENFHPYYSVGDFNEDGQTDFAVVVKSSKKNIQKKLILIFNGPFGNNDKYIVPFVFKGFNDSGEALSYFRYRRHPRLLVGRFETEGCAFEPTKHGYRIDCQSDED